MKKIIFLFLLVSFHGISQVGIGTATPEGALDIVSTTNGILVPRVALTANNASTPVVNPQGGALATGTLIWNTATAGTFPNNVIPGYYYWSGTIWIPIVGSAINSWALTGNSGTVPGTNYVGTSDPTDLSIATNGTEKIRITSAGRVGIGTSTLDPSALLEMTSTNKGVSFPNINLTSETDAVTIATPKEGLMVYNTNTSMPCGKGLYFNNGTSAAPLWSCFTKTTRQFHAYNTAARLGVTSTTATLQPGCTITFTIPTGQVADVKIDGVLGGLTTSTVAGRVALFDAIIYTDGAPMTRGGWNRTTLVNSSAGGNTIGVCTFSSAWVGVTAGVHTIQLFSSRVSGTSSVDLGGDCFLDTNCGEIHATVSYR